MIPSKTYQILINEYFSICKLRKKLDLVGALIQFSLITVLFCWKPAQIGQYKIVSPILLSLSLFYFFRSVSEFRRIEGQKSQMIVDGLTIEKQNKVGKKLFHEILEKFNLRQILIKRFVADLIAFGIIGYFIYQFLLEMVPSLSITRELLISLFAGGLSIFACKEYYEALKPLAGEKRKIVTKSNEASIRVLNGSESHRAQAIEYKRLAVLFKKNNLIGIVEIFATLGPLYFISDIKTPYIKLLGGLLAFLAVFIMERDYRRSKKLDEKVAKLVLNGIQLEKKNPSFERFFHNVLNEFSIVRILASRSLCTVLCVYFLCASINKIFVGKAVYGDHKIILGLIGAAIGAIVCVLYYSSYKKFDIIAKI